MSRVASLLLYLPLLGLAQDSRSRALESLEPLPGLIALTPPAMQAPLLLETARIWARLDKSRAIELLEQATAASGSLTSLDRESTLGFIAAELVLLDTRRAADLLALLPITPSSKSTSHAVHAHAEVISALLREKRYDAALEIANASGALRFLNVSYSILDALPKDHPARPSILAAALPPLSDPENVASSVAFLKKYLDDLPPESAASARAAVFTALGAKPTSTIRFTTTISHAGGSVHLIGTQQPAAFQHASFLRSLDPDAWKKYLEREPRFAALIAQYPDGEDSFTKGAQGVAKMVTLAEGDPGRLATPSAFEAEAAATNQRNALLLNRTLITGLEAAYDAATAESATDDDRSTFLRVALSRIRTEHASQPDAWLERVLTVAESFRDLDSRASQLRAAIDAAYDLKRPAIARKAIQRALHAAAQLRTRERKHAGAHTPSVLYWPSTNIYRGTAYAAAKHDPDLFPTLFAETQDPEFLLWLRLESARAWAGLAPPALTSRYAAPPD